VAVSRQRLLSSKQPSVQSRKFLVRGYGAEWLKPAALNVQLPAMPGLGEGGNYIFDPLHYLALIRTEDNAL